jgi:hypothetical protein
MPCPPLDTFALVTLVHDAADGGDPFCVPAQVSPS